MERLRPAAAEMTEMANDLYFFPPDPSENTDDALWTQIIFFIFILCILLQLLLILLAFTIGNDQILPFFMYYLTILYILT